MRFDKQVCVLKQLQPGFCPAGRSVGGIVRLETESGLTTVHLSLINVTAKSSGDYALYVIDKTGTPYRFSLGLFPSSFCAAFETEIDVSNGFAAGLIYEEKGVPVTVAFSETENFSLGAANFRRAVAKRALTAYSEKAAPAPQTAKPADDFDPAPSAAYDDEAVATENYFAFDADNRAEAEKNDKSENCNGENKDEYVRTENGDAVRAGKKETEKSGAHRFIGEDASEPFGGEKYSEDNPYYLSAKKELDETFEKFPEDFSLKTYFPDSKFVKINYSAGRFYLVGIIKENKKEKYICYGVPEKYSEKAPPELEGYCTFIPLSVFDLQGDGYWMMFQDAITGECVKKK